MTATPNANNYLREMTRLAREFKADGMPRARAESLIKLGLQQEKSVLIQGGQLRGLDERMRSGWEIAKRALDAAYPEVG